MVISSKSVTYLNDLFVLAYVGLYPKVFTNLLQDDDFNDKACLPVIEKKGEKIKR